MDRLIKRQDVEQFVIVDCLWTGLKSNLDHIDDARVQFVQRDIENYRSPEPFDEIYHLASPASPKWYMNEPVRTISANVLGAMRLLEMLKSDGRFCYTSTSEVYGDPIVSPQPETYRGSVDCTGPRSAYDESKRCVEALLFQAKRVNGLDVKVVRLFNVFGPRTRPDDGRAVSNFINQAINGADLTIFGDGRQTRSWGYVDDIMDALERFFWLDDCDYPGPLNIGNDREIPVIDVARYIIEKHFPRAKLEYLPPIPQDPTNRRPDLTLINKMLPRWKCAVEYEEGVDRTVDWFKSAIKK